MSTQNNVLISCGGKWVGMVLQFRQAMQRHPAYGGANLVVASSEWLTPAGCFADIAEHVPPIREPEYISRLLDVCQKHSVRVVVPLIDLDLERLAAHLDEFSDMGTSVVCPS